jgi:hypothetical protein
MAAIVRVKARPVLIPGYEVADKGTAVVAWVAGDLLSNSAAGWVLCPAAATEADGIALHDAYAGQGGVSIGIQGEIDGFSGLVPGAPLYPSATVPGGLDTTPAGLIRVKATTPSRIRFSFV